MALDIEIPGFDMLEEIGEGGMARVFLATQRSLGREVAIKVLRRTLQGGEDFQRRFLHEGQLLASLIHPNIVPIHDIGQTEEEYYMAMEYLRGGTLTDKVKQGLSVAEVIRICTQMAHALELAHASNIVHRDLKPSNIMFRDELTPVLTDFGIAKKTDAQHSLTKTGMVVGTPYYMSPEQITGKPVDGRSDLYSLGVMFYELLSGQLPFRAEEPLALAMQHVQEEPPPLPDKLKELQPIVSRMMAKAPDDRYQTMLAFCADIKELVMADTAFREQLSGETKLFNSDQFSDPRFGSGPLKVPERVTRDVKRAPTGGKPKAERRMGWKLPAAVVTVLAIGAVVLWQLFAPEPSGLSDKDQRMVDNLLNRVNGYISTNNIDEPPGENAVDMLNRVLQIAPEYGPAREAGQIIAEYYEIDAQLALDAGNLEAAKAEIANGLALAPDYKTLLDLQSQVNERLAAIERAERIGEMLNAAAAHVRSGRLIEPEEGNAYLAFQEVLKLDPVNQTASAGLNDIQQTLVASARDAIGSGRFDVARARLERAEELFPRSSLVAEARQVLFREQRQAQEELEVSALLAQADRLMDSQQYMEPADQNALDSFNRVLALRPDNERALAGLDTIARHFQTLAERAVAQNDFITAVDYATAGLRAVPDMQSLLDIQSRATNALDAVSREIQQGLQQAERYALEGRFLSPGGSALESYNAVLERDPDNARARAGIAELPDRIFSTLQQMQREEQFDQASDLALLAITQFPQDGRFDRINQDIDQALGERERRQRLAARLAESRRLVERRPITLTSITQAATALKGVLSEFPNDVSAVALLGDFTTAIGEEAERLSESGDDTTAFQLIDAGLDEFRGNRGLLSSRDVVESRRQQRIEEERARIAAISGQLAIDAMPWGEVIEIRAASGAQADLPSESATPLLLSLQEGDYAITVRGADGSNQKLDVTVVRQQLVNARADFGGMSADRYFERSGW